MKILVTGASGFIGSFIVEEGLRRGMEVWAAVRQSSSKQFLTDPKIHFIELDLSSKTNLEEQLRGHEFDYVVHAAGVTKCLNSKDFHTINTGGTKNLVRAILALKMPIKKFVYLSSLSVYGAIHEQMPYKEIRLGDHAVPNTEYGKSKLNAERFLDTMECVALPYVILRPTGVYGPRERDYFLMAKSIKQHFDFAVGYRQQDITFIYVDDLVQAVFLACEKGIHGSRYFLSDGQVYQSSTFSKLIRRELGSPWWIRITAPLWVLRVVTWFGDKIGHITGHITALNNDKYHILRQRNWRCDIEPARHDLGFEPKITLEQGVPLTIKWYKENGWI